MIYQIRKLSAGVINRQYFPSVTGDDRWDVATVKNLYASRSAWYWSEERVCTLLTKSVIGLGAAFPLSLMMKRSSWRKISRWGWKGHRCHCRVIITPSCDWFFFIYLFFFYLICGKRYKSAVVQFFPVKALLCCTLGSVPCGYE